MNWFSLIEKNLILKRRDLESRTASATISFEDDLIIVRIHQGVLQSIQMARENLALTAKLAGSSKCPLLVDLRKAQALPPEVRRFYADREVMGQYLAIGMLITASPFGRALGNFYLHVAMSGIKKQLFTDEQGCKEWLKTFLRQ